MRTERLRHFLRFEMDVGNASEGDPWGIMVVGLIVLEAIVGQYDGATLVLYAEHK